MADGQTTRSWIGRLVFVSLSLAVLFLRMLPISTMPVTIAPPDLLLLVTVVWVVRRPDLAPISLIVLIHFTADMFMQRPPGLMTALTVLGTEVLRRRAPDLRALSFPIEWATVTAFLVGLTVAYRVVLKLTLLPQAPMMLTFSETAVTILAYPPVVLVAYLIFGVSRPAMGEVDDRGKRI